MERIGIYGGTFNPPHIGHLQAAAVALDALGLSRLLLIPAGIAPHKKIPDGSPTPQQRLQMVQAAQTDPRIQVSDLELRRTGISYTYLTVLELKKCYPAAELILLMGTDMFLTLQDWVNPEIILENASIGVFYRGEPGERAAVQVQKEKLEQSGATVYLLCNDVIAISSTQLRRMLAFQCGDAFLSKNTMEYIRENGLYHVHENWKNLPMAQLENVVVGLVDAGRVRHILGCRDTAVELAKRWGVDETDAARAGLLHDITKALDGSLQLTLCNAYDQPLSDFSRKYPKTLHAFTGSLVAERIFGENPAVVSAIRHHTTGKANMTPLEKIIYVADYMEPGRNFPGVDILRERAFADLDGALKLGLEITLSHLNELGEEVSPASREALRWVSTHHP